MGKNRLHAINNDTLSRLAIAILIVFLINACIMINSSIDYKTEPNLEMGTKFEVNKKDSLKTNKKK